MINRKNVSEGTILGSTSLPRLDLGDPHVPTASAFTFWVDGALEPISVGAIESPIALAWTGSEVSKRFAK